MCCPLLASGWHTHFHVLVHLHLLVGLFWFAHGDVMPHVQTRIIYVYTVGTLYNSQPPRLSHLKVRARSSCSYVQAYDYSERKERQCRLVFIINEPFLVEFVIIGTITYLKLTTNNIKSRNQIWLRPGCGNSFHRSGLHFFHFQPTMITVISRLLFDVATTRIDRNIGYNIVPRSFSINIWLYFTDFFASLND